MVIPPTRQDDVPSAPPWRPSRCKPIDRRSPAKSEGYPGVSVWLRVGEAIHGRPWPGPGIKGVGPGARGRPSCPLLLPEDVLEAAKREEACAIRAQIVRL
jgi:hypothetical protein